MHEINYGTEIYPTAIHPGISNSKLRTPCCIYVYYFCLYEVESSGFNFFIDDSPQAGLPGERLGIGDSQAGLSVAQVVILGRDAGGVDLDTNDNPSGLRSETRSGALGLNRDLTFGLFSANIKIFSIGVLLILPLNFW